MEGNKKLNQEDILERILVRLQSLEDKMEKREVVDSLDRPSTSRGIIRIEDLETGPKVNQEDEDSQVLEMDDFRSVADIINEGDEEEQQEMEVLDEDLLEVLGADPSRSDEIEVELHPAIQNRWKAWTKVGVPKAEMEKIQKKYKMVEFLRPPKMNPEILATMNEAAVKRDRCFTEAQNFISAAMSCLGTGITMLLNEEQVEVDKMTLLQRLCDAGKLMAIAQSKHLNTRKAHVLPALDHRVRKILESTEPEVFMFGDSLGDKIKEAKAVNKISEGLKGQSSLKRPAVNTRPFADKRSLNYRPPSAGVRPAWQGGYKQERQGRRTIRFKTRNSQSRSQRQERNTRDLNRRW